MIWNVFNHEYIIGNNINNNTRVKWIKYDLVLWSWQRCDQMNAAHLCSSPCELLEHEKLDISSLTGGLDVLAERLMLESTLIVSSVPTTVGAMSSSVWLSSLLRTVGEGSAALLEKGEIALRNFLFRSVGLPVPSILILYWSKGRTSTTWPDLFHLSGLLPLWFCTRTTWPTVSGANTLVCLERSFSRWACLLASAFSLCSIVILHSGCSKRLPGLIGKKFLTDLPKITWAGLRPVSLSGVFLCRSKARRKLSLFKLPSGATLSRNILFADLTPCSALWFECGKYEDDTRWLMPQSLKNCWVSLLVYWVPPSLANWCAMPKVAKYSFIVLIKPLAPSLPAL